MVCAWKRLLSVAMAVLVIGAGSAWGQGSADPLKSGFENPPNGARPRVWWHWMNGNITKEGIKLDLEWMHRVGLGGFQNFDAALANAAGGRQAPGLHDAGVEGCLQVRDHCWAISWAWKRRSPARRAGANRAARGCRPRRHEEVCVERDALSKAASRSRACWRIRRRIPAPFRTMGIHDQLTPPVLRADSAVLRRRRGDCLQRTASDVPVEALHPKITASGGSPDFAMLSDGDLEKTTKLPIPALGRVVVDSVRISVAADHSRHHLCDQGS